MLHSQFSSPLSRRLIRVVFSIYFVFAILITISQLALEYHDENQKVGEEFSHLIITYAPIISDAVWELDESHLEAVVESILKNGNVLGIRIADEERVVIRQQGRVLITNGAHATVSPSGEVIPDSVPYSWDQKLTAHEFPLVHVEDHGSQNIGMAVIYSSSGLAYSRVKYTLWLTIANAFLKTAILVLIFLFAMRRWIVEPLAKITQAVEEMKPLDNESSKGDILASREGRALLCRDDELGVLVREFLEMCEQLKDKETALLESTVSIEALRSSQAELAVALEGAKAATLLAEDAGKAKSAFLATISHELRTPLNGILGVGQLLQETQLDTEQEEYVRILLQSGNKLLKLITDVLDFSQLETGSMQLMSNQFDLRALITRVIRTYAPQAETKMILLQSNIDHSVPEKMIGDAKRVEQILQNLVDNAIKFTTEGQVIVAVKATSREDTKQHVLIKVIDSGVGVDVQLLETLFDPFIQADASTTRRYGGAGMGLAICRNLVELMQGDIGCEITEDGGSMFWVKLILSTEIDSINTTPA